MGFDVAFQSTPDRFETERQRNYLQFCVRVTREIDKIIGEFSFFPIV